MTRKSSNRTTQRTPISHYRDQPPRHTDTKTIKIDLLFLCLVLRLGGSRLVNQERIVVGGLDTNRTELELLAIQEDLNECSTLKLALDQRF
jgi:hypothetical protein